jgi:hypothetical protein
MFDKNIKNMFSYMKEMFDLFEDEDENNMINLKKLLEIIDCEDPYNMCSDAMIQKHLDNKTFVNCKKSFHKGKNDDPNTHAKIIASLVHLLRKGVVLDEIVVSLIYDEEEEVYVEVDDGYHRLRAYKFLKYTKIPVVFEEIIYE